MYYERNPISHLFCGVLAYIIWPAHVIPFPVYPALHSHIIRLKSGESMQVAFTSHGLASVVQRSNPTVFDFENKCTSMTQASYTLCTITGDCSKTKSRGWELSMVNYCTLSYYHTMWVQAYDKWIARGSSLGTTIVWLKQLLESGECKHRFIFQLTNAGTPISMKKVPVRATASDQEPLLCAILLTPSIIIAT